MLEYVKKECSTLSFNLLSSIFCDCGVPFATRYRNLPCYHIHCQTCSARSDSQNKCSTCEALVEKVEELHPNEDILVCTVPNCRQGFLNFPSLKVHAKLSHSVNVDSVEDFYQKFGDTEPATEDNEVLEIENGRFKNVLEKRQPDSSPSAKQAPADSNTLESPKSKKKRLKSSENEDQLEILM